MRRCRSYEGLPGVIGLVIILSILTVTGTIEAQGQERTDAIVSGVVSDETTGSLITGAVVTIEGTNRSALTDAQGRYSLAAPSGPQTLRVEMIGYAPTRVTITIPSGGEVTQDVRMAQSALLIEGVTVTADAIGRARGELATATVIGLEAIRHQTATSLAAVLELMPGASMAPPGLDGVQQISMRSAPTSNTVGGTSAANITSFGTLIILDGIPQSNNANLQSLGPRGSEGFASSAGGGIDLRRIPAATIERVEVIRGVPSARFGDLTQGAIIVDTRAGVIDLEVAGKLDVRTGESSVLGGRRLDALGGTGTMVFDIARTQSNPGLSEDRSLRLAGQFAHRAEVERASGTSAIFDTRIDFHRLVDDRPEDPNIRPDRSYESRETGFSISERATLTLPSELRLSFTGAVANVGQRSFARTPRIRPALPFTDRIEPGRATGWFVGGRYVSDLTVEGAPWMLYSRIEGDLERRWLGFSHRLRSGAEFRREWNSGSGREFDMERPPQSNYNSVDGFDRPFRYDEVPPLVTSALYLDNAMRHTFDRDVTLSVQAGVRTDFLHEGSHWASGLRDLVVQPRLNAELQPLHWLRLRTGWGRSAKVPTLGDLFPWPQYYDLINVNWYAADPAERLAVLTTHVVDPTNEDLGLSVSEMGEVGFELGLGGSAISFVAFSDRIRDGVGIRKELGSLTRDRFQLTDSIQGTGQPPEIIEPPYATDLVPILIDRPDNIMEIENRGLELTAAFPEIRRIRTRFELQASWVRTERSADVIDFGRALQFNDLQLRDVLDRLPYWQSVRETGEQAIATYRIIHQQPAAGLVITATIQHNLFDRLEDLGPSDSLSYAGYFSRSGEMTEVPLERRGDPEFADLRDITRASSFQGTDSPADWMMGVQISKTLPLNGRFSFWAFNLLDRQGIFHSSETRSRLYPPMRFGVEVSMPIGEAIPW